MEAVILAVGIAHIRVRGRLDQSDAGRLFLFLLFHPSKDIGLHPVPAALGPAADIDKDPVLVRYWF